MIIIVIIRSTMIIIVIIRSNMIIIVKILEFIKANSLQCIIHLLVGYTSLVHSMCFLDQ